MTEANSSPSHPEIRPVPEQTDRPFWSVMIPVYDRLEYLELALSSVLKQALPADEMQIEVLNDGAAPEIQERQEALVERVAGSRVSFYRHPVNVGGGPRFGNVCVERARGYWVHILHDDDLVRPGFYAAMQRGIDAAPEIGMAMCRHIFMVGNQGRYSELERETAGVIENWLERIGWNCKAQFAALVVKREAYERVGGFSPQLRGASDWEMWQRIAVHYPVWFEPEPLACYRQHDKSLTGMLGRSGEHTAAIRRAIERMHVYFREHVSAEFADRITARARSYYGQYALSFADRFLRDQDYEAAFVNLQEALACCPTPKMQKRVGRVLRASAKSYHHGTIHEVDVVGDSDHSAYWSSITEGVRQPRIFWVLNERLRSGDTVCDIGAGLGGTTVFMGKKCPRVFAVESDTVAYQNLLCNLRLNGLTNVVPFHALLGETSGLVEVPVRGVRNQRGSPESMLVKRLAWSDWLSLFEIGRLDFIHLDTDGGEPSLLAAMEPYLVEQLPTLLVTTHTARLPAERRRETLVEMARILGNYRYCYDDQLVEFDLANLTREERHEQEWSLLLTNE